MKIIVASGTGEGPTAVAAFDAALLNAGVANYNLIPLSSIIPPGSIVERATYRPPPDEYGHRLYVVMARHDELVIGREAWAGVGWAQERESGRGLFVEVHASDKDSVQTAITASLTAMMASRRRVYGPIQCEITGIQCRENPVCALVIAVYKSEAWYEI